MKQLLRIIKRLCFRVINKLRSPYYGHLAQTSKFNGKVKVYNKKNLYMYENTNINGGGIIMNTRAKFIMKKNSGAALGLLVVTGNHMSVVGMAKPQVTNVVKDQLDINHEFDRDVIVDEDVWIGSRVTLLSGVHIGRGCVVGSNAVVRCSTPPYSIVVGNPAKVIGFRFSPREIIEHEKQLYNETERIDEETINKNYAKYYINKIKEIKSFVKL
ncbi:MAG: hypothetical protein IKX71_00405 [Bacteroidales bacterium]|nr:hypothetical protein [Bacteroidales bacterium]